MIPIYTIKNAIKHERISAIQDLVKKECKQNFEFGNIEFKSTYKKGESSIYIAAKLSEKDKIHLKITVEEGLVLDIFENKDTVMQHIENLEEPFIHKIYNSVVKNVTIHD